MDHKYAKLLLRQTRATTKADIFVADDELTYSSNLGRLFILIDINSREKKTKDLISVIIENVASDYYNSPTSDPEASLETTCQNFNLNLPDLVKNLKTFVPKLNIIFGVIKDNEIFTSSFGNIKSFLVRDGKFTEIATEKFHPSDAKKNYKIFSQIITGELETNDTFIFSNPTLFDYFSKEKIEEMTAGMSPEQVVEFIKNILEENTNPVAFASIFFKINKSQSEVRDEDEVLIEEFYQPDDSMQKLDHTEKNTKKILTRGISLSPFKALARLRQNIRAGHPASHKATQDKTTPKLDKSNQTADKPVIQTKTKDKRAKINIKAPKINYDEYVNTFKNNLKVAKQKQKNFVLMMKSLRTFSKVIIALIPVLVVVFVFSLRVIDNKKEIKLAHEAFLEDVALVDVKITEAENTLIYKDKEAAADLIEEVKYLIKKLPSSDPDWATETSQLNTKIKTTENKIYDIYEAEIVTWGEIVGQTIIDNIKDGNTIYSLTASGELWSSDLATKEVVQIADSLNFVKGEIWDNNNLIFVDNNNTFSTFNLATKTVSKKTLTLDGDLDWAVYGSRIYTFDPEGGQIVKITQPLSARPQETAWLSTANENIDTSSQIVIDGDIWITAGNEIARYFTGRDQHFEIKNLNEPFGNGIKIYREKDWPYIYVLDPANERLVIVRNSGIVEKQFTNPLLGQMTDIIVNDDQNTAFFFNGSKVVSLRFN